ncbi:MAG: ABC transporter ATP-binding protein/permease [Oscillospiraceae bacterium]|nr:ABC transporter ATP-binding protein/permease [Oscillospiraceae bacterium]
MSAFKWVWENLRGFRKRYLLCFFISMLVPMFVLINPTFQRVLIDRVLEGGEIDLLIPTVTVMCLVTLTRSLLNYASVALVESSSLGLVYNLRMKLYRHWQRQDMRFFRDNTPGDLMTVMTSDIDMIRHNLVFVFRQIISSALLFLGAAIYYFIINWRFALCMIALTPLIFLATYIYRGKVRGIYKELRRRLSKLNADAQENIEGNRVVKAFANEGYEIEKFNAKSDAFRVQNLGAQYIWLRFFPIIEGLSQSTTVTTLLFGGIFLINGTITPGDFMAFNSLSWAVTEPLRQLGQLFNDLQRFFASAAKIMSVLEEAPAVQNAENAATQSGRFNGEIEFRNVSFSFGGNPVLRDVSFHVKPGETLALMGGTGSGKSLIANLISRFYDVDSGEVLVDGKNVREWDLTTLRRNIGMTTQEVFLFSDTVDGNIAYGSFDMPEDDVRRCAEIAAAQFVDEMPEGFNTIVGERGVGLSGGQKQRIALARALAVRPPILILDDTTSAVDMETEKYIQEQLETLDFSCTSLIIAQRISSVRKADCILLLENGSIVERGTHEELLARRGGYYELWRIQSGVDEDTEAMFHELKLKKEAI